MLKHLKIFTVEQVGECVIIVPHGDGSAFRYQDLHMEANSIRSHLAKPGNRHLIIDLSEMEYFGSEFIGSLVSMARETKNRGGKSVICSAQPQMLEVLKTMSLFKLWPYFETRPAALGELENQ